DRKFDGNGPAIAPEGAPTMRGPDRSGPFAIAEPRVTPGHSEAPCTHGVLPRPAYQRPSHGAHRAGFHRPEGADRLAAHAVAVRHAPHGPVRRLAGGAGGFVRRHPGA